MTPTRVRAVSQSDARRAAWNPTQYGKFAAERAQPFWDLAALVERDGPIRRAVDLGCGPGELTAALAERLGVAEMVGVDSSPAMLAEAARARPSRRLRVRAGRHRRLDVAPATSTSCSATPPCSGCPTTRASSPAGGRRCAPAGSWRCRSRPTPATRRTASPARSPPASRSGRRWAATPPPDTGRRQRARPGAVRRSSSTTSAPPRQHVRLQVYGHTPDAARPTSSSG